MKKPTALSFLGLTLLLLACGAPSSGASPSPTGGGAATSSPVTGQPTGDATGVAETGSTSAPEGTFRHGVEGLIDDLEEAGADAEVTGTYDGRPLAPEGIIVCVNGQDIRVYSYASEFERAAVTSQIDPNDPSNMGTSIVEWDGWPQFWQRDRIIVLYQGSDEPTIQTLTDLMGEPFSAGARKPQMLPGGCESN